MKKIVFGGILLICPFSIVLSQTYTYSYDSHGNIVGVKYDAPHWGPTGLSEEEDSIDIPAIVSKIAIKYEANNSSVKIDIINYEEGEVKARIYNALTNILLDNITFQEKNYRYDISKLGKGIFIIDVQYRKEKETVKITQK